MTLADQNVSPEIVSNATDVAIDNGQMTIVAGEPLASGAEVPAPRAGKNGWTLVLICIGISLIACCLLIPQADENRQQLYQVEKLKVDLEHVKKQAQINEEFIKQINQDPTLAERLAQRQLHLIRKGTSVLELPGGSTSDADRSPYVLVSVAPPPPMPDCPKVGGRLAQLCRDARNRLYMIGGGLMLMATGLILGYSPKSEATD